MTRLPGSVLGAALILFLAVGCQAEGPGTDQGTFVVTLGTDTTAVERYTLGDGRLEVLAVTRVPRTLFREAILEFREEDGSLIRYESRVLDPAAEEEGAIQQTVIRYDTMGAERETTDRAGRVEATRVDADMQMIPFSFDHFSLTELAVRRALDRDMGSFYLLLGEAPFPIDLHRPSEDSVALDTGPLGTWLARVDGEGRILEMDAGALGRHVERVTDLDVDAIARRYADADARGEGMGPLSPRDTADFGVHGAEIRVEYARPSKRGREVYGGLVPWGEVWRTGADLATHLITDRPIELGGERLPAGSYSLFTIPEPDAWTLIVNEQTGQPGTEHDPDRDLLRVPMEVDSLDPPVERLTIVIEEDGDRGTLRIQWAETEARVSFRVEG